MKVDFYYWSYQCPLNNIMLEILREYEEELEISYHDISNDFALAEEVNMFFPTLTVVNDTHRYFSPIRKSFLDALCRGEVPIEKPYRPSLGTIEVKGRVVAINKNNFHIASQCTGQKCIESCNKKFEFYENKSDSSFGYINIDSNNNLLGGAEYIPSLEVPYNIPKDNNTAFLTCVYISDNDFDYKSEPLRVLEKQLALKYNKILVISDEVGVFPNGDLKFFMKSGYTDEGIISIEKDYCKLHLMSKKLVKD